jgi:SCF-associated factor 1
VLVYWQSSGSMHGAIADKMRELDERERDHAMGHATSDHQIQCFSWELRMDPFVLPPIPELPDLSCTGLPNEKLQERTKLVKIASFDNNLIGLTNKGHVLKYYGLDSETTFTGARWEYVGDTLSPASGS